MLWNDSLEDSKAGARTDQEDWTMATIELTAEEAGRMAEKSWKIISPVSAWKSSIRNRRNFAMV